MLNPTKLHSPMGAMEGKGWGQRYTLQSCVVNSSCFVLDLMFFIANPGTRIVKITYVILILAEEVPWNRQPGDITQKFWKCSACDERFATVRYDS